MPQFDNTVFLSQIFWMLLCLSAVFFFLWRTFVPRMLEITQKRMGKIQGQLKESDALQCQAQDLEQTSQTLLDKAHKDAKTLMRDALREINILESQHRAELSALIKKKMAHCEESITHKKMNLLPEQEKMTREMALHILNSFGPSSFTSEDIEETLSQPRGPKSLSFPMHAQKDSPQ